MGKITDSSQGGEAISIESRYYLLSQVLPLERFRKIAWAHWGIENRLYWVLE